MRIACLQFAPQVGDVDNNLNRADAVLSKANPQNIDLLVLPELAFSGEFGNRKGIHTSWMCYAAFLIRVSFFSSSISHASRCVMVAR